MTWLDQEIRNIYYYETITGNPSNAEWQDIVDEIRGDYVSELAGYLSNDWSFYAIDWRQVDTSGLPSFTSIPTAGPYTGVQTVDNVASQIALLVSVKENTTKPNRCRTYLGGFTEASITDSRWDAVIRSAAEDFVALQSVLNAAGTNELQRVSVTWNSTHTAVVAYNNVAGATPVASEVPATQRRRRLGVGI